MKKTFKFVALVLSMLMLVSCVTMVSASAAFKDVDYSTAEGDAVNMLSALGVTKGTSDTEFGTEELVTREQMAAFIYRLMKKGNSIEGGQNVTAFTDLEDPTYFFMISWANSQGIISGTSATTFNPKGSITLQDAYTMLVRALGYEKEEKLPYPFGHIEVAEKKGVELNKGLDASVSYKDALTRGDVAVLLYNTFFAETGVEETKQVEKLLGEGTGHETYVLVTKSEYPTFCEKYFDVLEVEYQAVATPNYAFDADESTGELGYDAIQFRYADEDSTDAPAEFYADVEDLKLAGKADDYIMSHFKMYITLDEDDAVDEILYAEPLMTKKVVNNIKLETLSTGTKYGYYGSDGDNAKRLSGKITFNGEVAYFYNAPYSYAKPAYSSGMNEEAKYELRNEKNLKFISFDLLEDEDEKKYKYFVEKVDFIDNDDEYFQNDSVTLVEKLSQVYTGGLYEAALYDVDGDGLYDYINYMPYTFAFANTDDDHTFFEDGWEDENVTLYTHDAFVEGEKIKNEDFFIGYINKDANYIKVVEVIKPVEAAVTDVRKGTGKITLSTGEKVSVKNGWALVSNYAKDVVLSDVGYDVDDVEWEEFDDALLTANAYEADDAKFYVYKNTLLYQDGIDSHVTFDSNLIIVTADEDGTVFETGSFNSSIGGRVTYAYAWVDGEMKYVPVNTEADVWPSIKTASKLSEKEQASSENPYYNKLATYSVDNKGFYTIKLLGNAYDDEDMKNSDYIGIDGDIENLKDKDDDSLQYYGEEAEGYLVKYSTKRFQIRDGASRTGTSKLVDFDLALDSDTIVLVRNERVDSKGETTIKFVEYSASSLTDTLKNKLENIQYVVENNPDYTSREKLVLLFAEANDEKLNVSGTVSKKAERIVKTMEVDKTDDDEYVINYTLFNPYTGKVEENVFGSNTYTDANFDYPFTYGDVVTLISGEVNEDESEDGSLLCDITELYWILDYDPDSEVIEVANVPADGDDSGDCKTYRISVEDAAITTIGEQSYNSVNMFKKGSISVVDADDLDGSNKTLKAINKKYVDPEDEDADLQTVYGKYLKVYLDIEWVDEDNHDEYNKNDCNGNANFVVVVANSNEAVEYCELD